MKFEKTTFCDNARAFPFLSDALQWHLVAMKSQQGFLDRPHPTLSDSLCRRPIAMESTKGFLRQYGLAHVKKLIQK